MIPQNEFRHYAGIAQRQVTESITHEGDCLQFLEAVKLCVCQVADSLYEGREREGIASENIDGYSVTFRESDSRRRVSDIIRKCLGNTGLLYAGVDAG